MKDNNKRKCHSCDKEFDDERLNRIVSKYEEKPPRYLCGPCFEKINNFIKAKAKLVVLDDIYKYFLSNENTLEKIENEIKDAYQKLIS